MNREPYRQDMEMYGDVLKRLDSSGVDLTT